MIVCWEIYKTLNTSNVLQNSEALSRARAHTHTRVRKQATNYGENDDDKKKHIFALRARVYATLGLSLVPYCIIIEAKMYYV